MTRRIGLTIGKFMPLHTGHEFMISFGASMMDELHVIVSGRKTDTIPASVRYNWVKQSVQKIENQLSLRDRYIYVHHHIDQSPDPKVIDEYGTVLDSEFQDYWRKEFLQIVPKATHFVSSDRYGKTMADLLSIKWLPVDPDREFVDISATKIRNDPHANFQWLSDAAKPYFMQTVAVVGPESVGKSTLVKRLAAEFSAVGIPEYGRIISEAYDNRLTAEDFSDIMAGQSAMIVNAIYQGRSSLIVSDSEGFTTALFSEIYLDDLNLTSELNSIARLQNFSLYLLLAPTVDWIDDGTRVQGNQADRQAFYERLRGFLDTNRKPYFVIDSKDFDARTQEAIKAVTSLLAANRRT